jgi:hypothetical protein
MEEESFEWFPSNGSGKDFVPNTRSEILFDEISEETESKRNSVII